MSRTPVGRTLRALEYRAPPGLRSLIRNDPIMEGLRTLHRRNGALTFLQLGSNDGVTNDPLYRFVVWHGWRGFAVEPVPEIFDRLRRNYAWTSRVNCLRVAVGSDPSATFYSVRGTRPNDPFWANQIGSFDRDHVLGHVGAVPDLPDRLAIEDVRVVTVARLWAEIGRPRVDLLHVDLEGADADALRTVPFEEMQLRAVLYEHAHTTRWEAAQIGASLEERGFRVTAETDMDRLMVQA